MHICILYAITAYVWPLIALQLLRLLPEIHIGLFICSYDDMNLHNTSNLVNHMGTALKHNITTVADM